MSSDSSAAERHQERAQNRRMGAVAVDQAISGASNALFAILAARTLDPTGFGQFGVVFLILFLAQVIPRALVGQPVLIHPEEADESPGEALGSGLAVGIAVGALIALTGAVIVALGADQLGLALVILGALFPVLNQQDIVRFIAFATRKPGIAVCLDVLWLVLIVAGFAVAQAVTDL